MKLKSIRNIALGVLLSLSAPIFAGNLSFLKSGVLSEFSKEDAASFKAAIYKSLDESKDKSIVTWHSKSSDLSGKILPKVSYETNGIPCRRTLFLLLDKKERRGHYRFDICKIDNQWKIKDSPIAHFSKVEFAELEIVLRSSLNNQSSGHPIAWHNKKSGNSAVVVALVPSSENRNCRKTAISLISKSGETSSGTYLFCQGDDMKWERELSEH